MIEKIGLSQYRAVDKKKAVVDQKKSSTESSQSVAPENAADKVVISDAGKKAQEVAKYTALVKALPDYDEAEVKEYQAKISVPGYFKKIVEDTSDDLADKIVNAADVKGMVKEPLIDGISSDIADRLLDAVQTRYGVDADG